MIHKFFAQLSLKYCYDWQILEFEHYSLLLFTSIIHFYYSLLLFIYTICFHYSCPLFTSTIHFRYSIPLFTSTFVCSLNPVRQTFIPQLLFHFSLFFTKRLSTYLFRAAHTPACWIGTKRNKTFTLLLLSQSGTRIIGLIHRVCEFRIKRKETDCSVMKRS